MKKIALFLLLISSTAKAEINIGLSVDWMCAKADVIVRAVITDVLVYRSARPLECSATVLEVIKGKASPEGISFNADNFPNLDYHVEGDTMILFLKVDTSAISGFSLFYHGLTVGGDPYMYSALNVNHNTQVVLTADFKALTSGADILAYVKKAVPLYPPGKYLASNVDIPADTGAYKHLWAGSACWLIVPKPVYNVDEKPFRLKPEKE